MKIWKEYLEWTRRPEVVTAPFAPIVIEEVDDLLYPDLVAFIKAAAPTSPSHLDDMVSDFSATTPKSLVLLPFTHCHRLVMQATTPNKSKLIQVPFDETIGILATARQEFRQLSQLDCKAWRIRGRVTAGGVVYFLVAAHEVNFVQASHLSKGRLILQGTGSVQQHFTTGCSRIESAIASCCLADGYHDTHPSFFNLTFGGQL